MYPRFLNIEALLAMWKLIYVKQPFYSLSKLNKKEKLKK
jgi:hypothetical protein